MADPRLAVALALSVRDSSHMAWALGEFDGLAGA
jgi:hypothetical protein